MTEPSTDGTTSPESNQTGRRPHRHFFWGLIIGVLATAIIGVGATLIADPDFFSGDAVAASEPMPGGMLQSSQVVTAQDFDAAILKSGRLELVLVVDTAASSPALDELVETIDMAWDGNGVKYYYATDAASMEYISKLHVYTEEGPPILAMFYQGKVVAKKSLLTDADSLLVWMNQNRQPKPTPTPTTAPRPEPAPEPASGPAVFRAFTSSIRDWFQPSAGSKHYLSEVILSAVDFDIDGFVTANQAITASVQPNTALYSLIGNRFGGDATSFVLPDLSGQSPLAGLDYQIAIDGIFPVQDADEPAESHSVGDIKYVAAPISSVYDVADDLYYGEILLVRGADAGLDLSRYLVPCDGRELSTTMDPALFALLGTRFGGNGTTTFRVPDLTGKSPIEGAAYFIVVQGIFPSQGDGLPRPTPTPTPAPVSETVVYRSFLSAVDDRIRPSATAGYYLGEVILSLAGRDIDGFLRANKASTVPVAQSKLFSLIGNGYGGDSTSFVVPGLSGQLPSAGLTYFINTSGDIPPQAAASAQPRTVGSVKYVETSVRNLIDVDDRVSLGEIILVKTPDGAPGLSRRLVPCDGRSAFVYSELRALVGGDLASLPDLQGTAPVEGAQYYIVAR